METIWASKTFRDVQWLETDYPAFIIDDFLTAQECANLVNDGSVFIESQPSGYSIVMGGRDLIPFSSGRFSRLIESSASWSSFQACIATNTFNLFKRSFSILFQR